MTQETFESAIKLHHRLQELIAAKAEIEGHTCRLIFQYQDCRGDWHDVSEYKMQNISDILDRHDAMIRKEIDKEIEGINRQIAEL